MIATSAYDDVNADPADGSEQDCEIRGWACQDANYNVIGFVDDDLAVLERYEYTPYGQRVVFYSAGSNDPLAHTPTLIPRRVELSGTSGGYGAYAIGHQGLYHDEETAPGGGAGATLVYNRARMLHTRLGRFTQRDPLEYKSYMNQYCYVHSNPIRLLDPDGKDAIGDGFEGGDLRGYFPSGSPGWSGTDPRLPKHRTSLPQDAICSIAAGRLAGFLFPNIKVCCLKHDNCYMKHDCNSRAWLPQYGSEECKCCNKQLLGCIGTSGRFLLWEILRGFQLKEP